ncbi:hypothetical protein [Pseudarthrobacter raffinosi]|nr:hypothetical protein [Pseudarthrobacter sp. MDT3-9]MCO4253348.1 hypothetical protein [Pseudarthrobacter sp. MDT3-9]
MQSDDVGDRETTALQGCSVVDITSVSISNGSLPLTEKNLSTAKGRTPAG